MDARVVRARLMRFRVPFRGPYRTALGSVTVREGFIVELEASDGTRGLGEASLRPGVPGIEGLEGAVRDSVQRAIGRPVLALTHGGEETDAPSAACVEIAAWDLLARARGRGLASVLTGGSSLDVPVNALVTAVSPEAVYVQASAAKRAGFETVKLKIGVCENSKQEVERVMAGRSALGANVALRLDANGVWSEDEAFNIIKTFAPYQPEYVEQPVAPGNLEAMRMIRESTRIPIAADEDADDVESALRVIEGAAADVLVLKPLQLGGIGPTRRVIEAAAQAGVDVVITTSIDTGVGTAAALHLAASLGSADAAGLATLELLESSLIAEEMPIVRGRMTVPRGLGLDVTLDRGALARYVVREEVFP
jgi:o-succinylbenzoate synthase